MSVKFRKKRIDQLVKMLKLSRPGVMKQTTIDGKEIDIRYLHMKTLIASASYEIGVSQRKIYEYLLVLDGIGLIQLNSPTGMITLEGELVKGVK